MDVQQDTRISQLLPSVKCSDCGEMVEFRRLGEHICQAAPAVPALPSAYRKPTIKNQTPSSRQVDNILRPNLNPLSVSDNSYDVGRSPYDTSPSPTDSGYSGYSGSKYTSPPSSTSSPKGPTNFLQKYEQMTGKQINSSSQSPRSSPTSPIDNNQEYYNNGYPTTPKRFDRPQDNFNNINGNDYPYGQGYPSDRGILDPRKFPNNDRYIQQQPFDENNNRYNMDDPYRTGKPRVPNDPYVQRPDDRYMRNQNPNDRYNDYMRGPPPPSSNQPYLRDFDPSRKPTYDRQNGQSPYNYDSSRQSPRNISQEKVGPQPPFSKPYVPQSSQGRYDQGSRSNTSDSYEGNKVDDLMNDLMREMDSMQIPPNSFELDEPRSKNGRDICAYCKTEIVSQATTMWALGKTWHSDHLLCAHCRKPIDPNVGHVEREGNVYCPNDFTDLFLPKCRRCNLPVEKEAVSASDGKLEGKWHVKCFGCHTCYKSFPDKSFYVFENAPYCRRHYHKLNNSLCKTCDEPIEGPCVQTVEGWRYHPSCFVCLECQIPLTNIYYSFDNKQYCETHIMEIKRIRKIRPERRQTIFRNI
ncbi:unnamed protein product [Rhizophagus irregularis]|uniref:LIM zinc-binding domain-containing protein n=1 Tax=Rhizophagus irregularis TaxID=588596 RepID=A0A2N1N637_9GLOM|nr:hypothetical protein RhiirC2_748557 [Rhizophagus irregularis]CAB4396643.1 unnamed protein product [Rhizophagus irregularis]CAB5344286.1 unnamed protein product [Rhizophagus irregularis]